MAAISATVALYRALIKKGVLAREALQRLGIGARAERENDGSRIWPKPGGWGAAHASPLAPVLFGNPSSSALPVAPARWRHRYWSRYDDGGEDNRPNVAFPEIASRPEDILRNAFVPMTSAGSVRSFGDCAVRDAFHSEPLANCRPHSGLSRRTIHAL